MTNIDYKLSLRRKVYLHSYLKWHGLLLHPYASSCCTFPQRSSSLTHLSRSTQNIFSQLQRSWWSHCMALFLPKPRVRLMNSCPESLVPARNGDFYKDERLHGYCCSGIWIGDHNHARHQSLGRTIQRTVRSTVMATGVLVDPKTIRVQVLLPINEAHLVEACVPTDARITRVNSPRKAHITYLKNAHG